MALLFCPHVIKSQAITRYDAVDLGTLGDFSSAAAITDGNDVVGETGDAASFAHHAFVFTDGKMTVLGELNGFDSSLAIAVNSKHDVLGDCYNTTRDGERAFLYHNHVLSDVGDFGGITTEAGGINEAGTAVGGASAPTFFHPFIYMPSTGIRDLQVVPGYLDAFAEGINNTGTIVLSTRLSSASNTARIALLKNGIFADLGTISGVSTSPVAINDNGFITGTYGPIAGSIRGFLYDGHTFQDIAPFTISQYFPKGLNNLGQVVGYAPGPDGLIYGFIYSGSSFAELTPLIDFRNTHLTKVDEADGINNRGIIAASAFGSPGQVHAVLLIPTNLDISLNVVPLHQYDDQWKQDQYATSQWTINEKGCALTCLCMAFDYAAAVSVNPETFNRLLVQNDAYDQYFSVDWWAATQAAVENYASGSRLVYRTFYGSIDLLHADLEDIRTVVRLGKPVILAVDPGAEGWGHFVLAVGTSGSEILINDPGHQQTLLSAYPEFQGRGFIADPENLGAIEISTMNSVDLTVTDATGAKTGVDPGTGSQIDGIPFSAYYIDAIENAVTGQSASSSSRNLLLANPATAKFQVLVTPKITGAITLKIQSWGADGSAKPAIKVPLIGTLDVPLSLTLNYDQNRSTPTTIVNQGAPFHTTYSGYTLNRRLNAIVQTVSITNLSDYAITSPIDFVLEGLSTNTHVLNATGTIANSDGTLSPYFTLPQQQLGGGGSYSLVLEFAVPSSKGIIYTGRVVTVSSGP